jgi:hypothetical protein
VLLLGAAPLTNKKSPAKAGLERYFAVSGLRQRPKPCVYIFFDLILGQAIAFLKLTLKLVLLPIDDIEIVIG